MSKEPVIVRVSKQIKASSEKVFDAWFDPELLGKWMFGPALREEEIVRLTTEAKVGGTFSFVVRRQGTEIDHIGKYLEIDRPKRLVFTWGIAPMPIDKSSRVSIDVIPLWNGCEINLIHELHPDWADYAARTEAGWTKMIHKLAGLLEAVH